MRVLYDHNSVDGVTDVKGQTQVILEEVVCVEYHQVGEQAEEFKQYIQSDLRAINYVSLNNN